MDLRFIIALLFIFITGGRSLKCYECTSVLGVNCDAKEKTCAADETKCKNVTTSLGSNIISRTKGCAAICKTQTIEAIGGKISTYCCDTDLCNAADGVYKGSFLLLVCPLIFYFLFH